MTRRIHCVLAMTKTITSQQLPHLRPILVWKCLSILKIPYRHCQDFLSLTKRAINKTCNRHLFNKIYSQNYRFRDQKIYFSFNKEPNLTFWWKKQRRNFKISNLRSSSERKGKHRKTYSLWQVQMSFRITRQENHRCSWIIMLVGLITNYNWGRILRDQHPKTRSIQDSSLKSATNSFLHQRQILIKFKNKTNLRVNLQKEKF